AHGSASVNNNGTPLNPNDDFFVYTPAPGWSGTDSFVYKVHDGRGGQDQANVTVTVRPVNHAPTGVNDAYTVSQGATLEVLAQDGVLANDTDVDGDVLVAVLVSGVSHGKLMLGADGGFTYIPNLDYHGTDSFTYKANDGHL